MKSSWSSLAIVLLVPACGQAPPRPIVPAEVPPAPASASASSLVEPPEPPPSSPRTGPQPPIDHAAPIDAVVVGRHVDADHETLELRMPKGLLRDPSGIEVSLDEGAAHAPLVLVAVSYASQPEVSLLLRRAHADEGKPIVGKIHTPASGSAPGHRYRFRAPGSAGARDDRKLVARWALLAAGHARLLGGPFGLFASSRVVEAFVPPPPAPRGQGAHGRFIGVRPDRDTELVAAMETFSGVSSVQEALQANRPLLFAPAAKRTIPIANLTGPRLERHPWSAMSRALGKPAPAEPLADAVPADGWYVRSRDLAAVFRLIDEIDEWGTPILEAVEGRGEERGLAVRYETALGLGRGPLTRAFGPDVVAELCATGSDPYFQSGTDITLLFRTTRKAMFEAGLALTLAGHGTAHGGLETSSFAHEGTEVRVTRSRDGSVRQHRATVGELELVSNSAGSIRRVLDVIGKRRPALSGEPDFQYMLARDADVRADVLAFAGDRFIGEVSGPRQKIAEARREIALAELATPAYAALLYGMLEGESPAGVDALVKAKLLLPRELEHGPKDPITFVPGEAPHSSWGTPASPTPLVDVAPVTDVTPGEKAAYDRFATMYRSTWAEYIDPVALRVAVEASGFSAALRVLPIVDSPSYRDLLAKVGHARVAVPALGDGARVVFAIGANADLRRELSATVGRVPGLGEIGLDWLGEWAMVGTGDRRSLLGPARGPFADLERPRTTDDEDSPVSVDLLRILELPLYAEVHLKSPAAAAIALVGLRKMAHDAAPGMFDWGEVAPHRGVAVVRVHVHGGIQFVGSVEGGTSLFYALHDDVLIAALREGTLHGLLDDRLDGRGPTGAPRASATTQHVVEAITAKDGPLATVLGWALESAALRGQSRSRALAWTILRGIPETREGASVRTMALAYLGAAPLSPDGGGYSLGEDGVRDRHRGSRHAPVFPPVPVPGSPVEKLLRALAGVRIETSFDDEARVGTGETPRSLSARVFLRTRK